MLASASPRKPRVEIRFEVLLAGDLARGVAPEAERGVLRGHPQAVIPDLDELLPAVEEIDPDLRCFRVQGVLDELLDDGNRPFDDLAGRDFLGKLGRKNTDSLHRSQPIVPVGSRAPGRSSLWRAAAVIRTLTISRRAAGQSETRTRM